VKNILLVEPKSPEVNVYSLFKIPRMGLAILGTLARQAGFEVRIIFQESVTLKREHILWADLVGLSLTTSTAQEGYRLARVVRALDRYKDRPTTILFGGVHPTFRAEEALGEGDYVLRGEADHTFVPFLEALREGRSPEGIEGLSWRTGTGIRHNPLPGRKVDMNSLPTPDWSLFEGHRFHLGAVMTSRGCPYDCSFCSVTAMLGRSYRQRSVDRILEDVARTGSRQVFFYDDHFTAHTARTKELLRRLIAERGKTHQVRTFSAQVRVEIAKDPELLDLMKQAGFSTLFIGFESVNPATLELYNKGQTVEEIETAVKEIHRRGIGIHGMFVLGSDADDEDTFEQTLEFVRRNRIETVQFLILTPFPGTRQYEQFEKEGRMLSHDWSRFDGFNTVYSPRLLTPYQLQAGMLRVMKRFYSLGSAASWLLRGNAWIALLHLVGWWSVHKWLRHNGKRLKNLRRESGEFFLPLLDRVDRALSATYSARYPSG